MLSQVLRALKFCGTAAEQGTCAALSQLAAIRSDRRDGAQCSAIITAMRHIKYGMPAALRV